MTSQKMARWSLAIAAAPIAWMWWHWGSGLPWWLYLICWIFLGTIINVSWGLLNVLDGSNRDDAAR